MKWKTGWLFDGMKFPQEPTVEGNIYSGTIYLCEILESQLRTNGNSFLCLRSWTGHWSQTLFSQCLVLQITHPLFFFLNWKMSVMKVMPASEAPRPAPTSRRWQSDTKSWLPSHCTTKGHRAGKAQRFGICFGLGPSVTLPMLRELQEEHNHPRAHFCPSTRNPPSWKAEGSVQPKGETASTALETANNVGTSILQKESSWREAQHCPASALLPLHAPSAAQEQSETAVGLQGSTPVHRETHGMVKQPLLESMITTGLHISKSTLYLLNYKTWKQHVQVIYQ